MKDKRKECGCHKECTTLEHICDKPCTWPNCLTALESAQLDAEIMRDVFGHPRFGPLLQCAACGHEALDSELFERHELSPEIWKWFDLTCVQVLDLDYGK